MEANVYSFVLESLRVRSPSFLYNINIKKLNAQRNFVVGKSLVFPTAENDMFYFVMLTVQVVDYVTSRDCAYRL